MIFCLILGGIALFCLGGWFWRTYVSDDYCGYADGWQFAFALSGIAVAVILLFIMGVAAGSRYDDRKRIAMRAAFINDMANRRGYSEIERAAVFKDVLYWNQWLTAVQYENARINDIFHDDGVDALRPITDTALEAKP